MAEHIFSKKCDLCGIQPAALFFRVFNAQTNNIQEEGLCPKCALKKFTSNDSELENQDILQTINQMRNVLTDIVGHISKLEQTDTAEKCSICKTTAVQFQQTKIVGCSNCYQEFEALINEHIKPNSFSNKHKGIIPKRHKSMYLKQLEIDKLKINLQAALRIENYEDAIKIKKRLAKLEENPSID